jgi:hypothetical protein
VTVGEFVRAIEEAVFPSLRVPILARLRLIGRLREFANSHNSHVTSRHLGHLTTFNLNHGHRARRDRLDRLKEAVRLAFRPGSHIGWAVSAVALRPRFCRPPPNRTGDFRTHPALRCPEVAKGFGHGHVAHLTLPGSGPPAPLRHVDGFPALGLLRGLCRRGADPGGVSNPLGDLVFHIM